jgi:transposase-like protein
VSSTEHGERLAAVVASREAAAAAYTALRGSSVDALAVGVPLRQVAIAADVSRDTLYRWRREAG